MVGYKTKFMFMPLAVHSYTNITASKSVEIIIMLKCLETTIANQNYIRDRVITESNLGKACYCSAKYLLSFPLLYKVLKIK